MPNDDLSAVVGRQRATFMKWPGLLAAALIFAGTTGTAQIGNELSLSQAVQAAIKNQPLMQAAQLCIDLADKRVREARKGRLPSLRIAQTDRAATIRSLFLAHCSNKDDLVRKTLA